MQSKIEEIEEKDKGLIRVKIDNEWYSAWDDLADQIIKLGVGSLIDFTFVERGKYKNIKTISHPTKNLAVKELNIESYTKGYNDALHDVSKNMEKMKK